MSRSVEQLTLRNASNANVIRYPSYPVIEIQIFAAVGQTGTPANIDNVVQDGYTEVSLRDARKSWRCRWPLESGIGGTDGSKRPEPFFQRLQQFVIVLRLLFTRLQRFFRMLQSLFRLSTGSSGHDYCSPSGSAVCPATPPVLQASPTILRGVQCFLDSLWIEDIVPNVHRWTILF
jgi:hypothetical protein